MWERGPVVWAPEGEDGDSLGPLNDGVSEHEEGVPWVPVDERAGEAETDGALSRREFVVQGVLRGAAADGCPRGTF
jgi:hypothetical protein